MLHPRANAIERSQPGNGFQSVYLTLASSAVERQDWWRMEMIMIDLRLSLDPCSSRCNIRSLTFNLLSLVDGCNLCLEWLQSDSEQN